MKPSDTRYWIFTGPESTAKTTLARRFAEHLGRPLVEEQARELLELGVFHGKNASHVLALAEMQYHAELAAARDEGLPLVLDTDLVTYWVWFEWRFGPAPRHWIERLVRRTHTHYFLCSPDIPWQPDPLRVNPDDREDLLAEYRKRLEQISAPYTLVTGHDESRWDAVLNAFGESGHTA